MDDKWGLEEERDRGRPMVSRSFPWVGTKPWAVAGFGPTGSGREVLLLCGGGPALLFLDKKKKGKGYHRPSWFSAAVGWQKILCLILCQVAWLVGLGFTSRAGSVLYIVVLRCCHGATLLPECHDQNLPLKILTTDLI